MTLYRQIALLVSSIFMILFFILIFVIFSTIKNSAEKSLYENAQNVATALSIAISNTPVVERDIQAMIDASFDNGNYQKIVFKGMNENVLYKKESEEKIVDVPVWFKDMFELDVSTAKGTISENWEVIGDVEVLNDKGLAYLQMYDIMKHLLIYIGISCVLFLTVLAYVFHLILKPLFEIEKQASSAMENRFVIQQNIPFTKEFRTVVKSINSMVRKFETIFKTANKVLSENKELLYKDVVADISNRKYFILKATEYLGDESSKNSGCVITLSFKEAEMFNQIIGYKNTSIFIRDLAIYMKSLIKHYNDFLISRLNGTEIVIMLPRTSISESLLLTKSILRYVESKVNEFGLNKDEFGVSLGILSYQHGLNTSELFSLIDYSLEQARLLPYGEYHILENDSVSIGRGKWRQYLKNGLKNDGFEVVYRKVIDTKNSVNRHYVISFVLNVENHSYPYGMFIAPVVDLGMIKEVYLHIIKKVLSSLSNKTDSILSVQLSSHFLNNLDTYEKLKHLFEETKGRLKNRIIFEIPESFIIKHFESTLHYIKLFSEYGFDFAINNFIADSEDYSYLKELKPVYIKADKKYLLDKDQKIEILKVVLEAFGIELIATGVNNIDEKDSLNKKGIDVISGSFVESL